MTPRSFTFEEIRSVFVRPDAWTDPETGEHIDPTSRESIIFATKIVEDSGNHIFRFPISVYDYSAVAHTALMGRVYEMYRDLLDDYVFDMAMGKDDMDYALITPIVTRPQSKNLAKLLEPLLVHEDTPTGLMGLSAATVSVLASLTTPEISDSHTEDAIRTIIGTSEIAGSAVGDILLGHLKEVGAETFTANLQTLECMAAAVAATIDVSQMWRNRNIDVAQQSLLVVTSDGCFMLDQSATEHIDHVDDIYRSLDKLLDVNSNIIAALSAYESMFIPNDETMMFPAHSSEDFLKALEGKPSQTLSSLMLDFERAASNRSRAAMTHALEKMISPERGEVPWPETPVADAYELIKPAAKFLDSQRKIITEMSEDGEIPSLGNIGLQDRLVLETSKFEEDVTNVVSAFAYTHLMAMNPKLFAHVLENMTNAYGKFSVAALFKMLEPYERMVGMPLPTLGLALLSAQDVSGQTNTLMNAARSIWEQRDKGLAWHALNNKMAFLGTFIDDFEVFWKTNYRDIVSIDLNELSVAMQDALDDLNGDIDQFVDAENETLDLEGLKDYNERFNNRDDIVELRRAYQTLMKFFGNFGGGLNHIFMN